MSNAAARFLAGTIVFAASLVVIILFATFAAVAQTNGSAGVGGGKFRANCGEDVQQFCIGVRPGGGRLVQCLSSHIDELSAPCGNMISAAGRGGAKLRAACDQDLQQFCVGVQPGEGRLVQCLSSHTNELSAACGNMISAAGRGGAKLRAVCDQDLQQFCMGVQPVRGAPRSMSIVPYQWFVGSVREYNRGYTSER